MRMRTKIQFKILVLWFSELRFMFFFRVRYLPGFKWPSTSHPFLVMCMVNYFTHPELLATSFIAAGNNFIQPMQCKINIIFEEQTKIGTAYQYRTFVCACDVCV